MVPDLSGTCLRNVEALYAYRHVSRITYHPYHVSRITRITRIRGKSLEQILGEILGKILRLRVKVFVLKIPIFNLIFQKASILSSLAPGEGICFEDPHFQSHFPKSFRFEFLGSGWRYLFWRSSFSTWFSKKLPTVNFTYFLLYVRITYFTYCFT